VETDEIDAPVTDDECEKEAKRDKTNIEVEDNAENEPGSSSTGSGPKPGDWWAAARGLGLAAFHATKAACESESINPSDCKPVLIEFACAENSMLGAVAQAKGVKVIRLHKEFCDLETDKGIKLAWKLARDNPGCHIHASLPCTPWSRWQDMNIHRWGARFRIKLGEQRKRSLVMLNAFIGLAKYIHRRGGAISYEWPRYSVGWDLVALQDFEKDLGCIRVAFDGCSVGVRSTKGQPIKKPWLITTTNLDLVNALKHKVCNKQHMHAECAGSETNRTGFYPKPLCEIIVASLPNVRENHTHKDQWIVGHNRDSWERIHKKYRQTLFNPRGVAFGPDLDLVDDIRDTCMMGKDGKTTVVRTTWRSADANKAIPGPWIGRTIFYRIGMVPDQLPTSSVTPVIKVNTKTTQYACSPTQT
jgi:hypothetical protein